MTDARERVARAICRQSLISTRQPDDAETMEHYWNKFLPEADAALSSIGYEEIVGALEIAKWYADNFPSKDIPGDKPFVDDLDKIEAALRKARGEP